MQSCTCNVKECYYDIRRATDHRYQVEYVPRLTEIVLHNTYTSVHQLTGYNQTTCYK